MRKDSNLLLAKQLKTMKTNIQIFTSEIFGEIRTCQVNNQIMFVGKDVATALGYSNVRDALSKHVDSEDKGVAKCDTLGGAQNLTLINESGLYSLILSSKLPQAKAFKRWVTAVRTHVAFREGAAMAIQENGADGMDFWAMLRGWELARK